MKVLVTGGTGFLGRHLVWRLASQGHDVSFAGRDASKARDVAALCPRPIRAVRLSHGEPGAGEALTRATAGCDAVVHCAALSSPWGSGEAFRRANIASTAEVLAAVEANAIPRLVHISTPSIYFQFRHRVGIREEDPLPPPVNTYAKTKRAAEDMIRAAGVSAIILRPRAIFGPWDQTLLPRLLRLMHGRRFPLFNGGTALLDLSYVDNVVDAIVLGLTTSLPAGSTFNITNGQPVSAADLFALLARAFGLPYRPVQVPLAIGMTMARVCESAARLAPGWEPPLTRYTVGAVSFSQTLDLQRARDLLGYVPRVDLDEGIRRTRDWFHSRSERR